jgi:hypothetical protein
MGVTALRGGWSSFVFIVGLFFSGQAVWAGSVQFVVAEREPVHRDSFIVSLENEADIAHARDLIARGPDAAGAPIVFAEIRAGADGVNRNTLAPGQPLWNWHVSRFEGFGDFGIELIDGWPTFVESDVQGWIENTRRSPDEETGHIGFWSYTIVSEITDPTNPIPLPPGVGGGLIGLASVAVARRWMKR